jgi:hypothetical protein
MACRQSEAASLGGLVTSGADACKFMTVGEAAPLGYGYTDYIPDCSAAQGDKILL